MMLTQVGTSQRMPLLVRPVAPPTAARPKLPPHFPILYRLRISAPITLTAVGRDIRRVLANIASRY